MSDTISGLNARDDLLWIVAQWGSLRAHLRPGGGNALGVTVQTSDRPSPINVHIADLMRDVEENVARFYGKILMDETEWAPKTSAMPALLSEVAIRYGHFTTDPETAAGFCDDAHDYRQRVTKALEQPVAPTYIGPCRTDNCDGELYLRDDRDAGVCRECGQPFTLAEQRQFLKVAMEDRLMTQAELPRALKVLGLEVKPGTVRKWVERERLIEVIDGLYRLADAKVLAEKGKPVSRVA